MIPHHRSLIEILDVSKIDFYSWRQELHFDKQVQKSARPSGPAPVRQREKPVFAAKIKWRPPALTFNLYGKSNDTYDFQVDSCLVLRKHELVRRHCVHDSTKNWISWCANVRQDCCCCCRSKGSPQCLGWARARRPASVDCSFWAGCSTDPHL